jgi:hypothetical protein
VQQLKILKTQIKMTALISVVVLQEEETIKMNHLIPFQTIVFNNPKLNNKPPQKNKNLSQILFL